MTRVTIESIEPGTLGIVYLKEHITHPSGKFIRNVAGYLSMINDKEHLGFRVRGNESNWAIEVSGDEGTMYVLGCQIRAVQVFNNVALYSRSISTGHETLDLI